jgi:hypothetical protein
MAPTTSSSPGCTCPPHPSGGRPADMRGPAAGGARGDGGGHGGTGAGPDQAIACHGEEVELLAGRELPGAELHGQGVCAVQAPRVRKRRLQLRDNVAQRQLLQPHVPPDQLRVRLPPHPPESPQRLPLRRAGARAGAVRCRTSRSSSSSIPRFSARITSCAPTHSLTSRHKTHTPTRRRATPRHAACSPCTAAHPRKHPHVPAGNNLSSRMVSCGGCGDGGAWSLARPRCVSSCSGASSLHTPPPLTPHAPHACPPPAHAVRTPGARV